MDNRSLALVLAGAGLVFAAAALLGRSPGRRRALHPGRVQALKDRHIMVLIGKQKGDEFRCAVDLVPKSAPVHRGKQVTWHVVNQCEDAVQIDLMGFRNAQGEYAFKRPPSPNPVYVKPQEVQRVWGILATGASLGSYPYEIAANGSVEDPELIMQ